MSIVHALSKDVRESRMREIRTSGLMRGEAMFAARHATIEARPGNRDTDLGRSLTIERSSSTLLKTSSMDLPFEL